ncbi:biotin--[acetyl-CoA-carboxylase] ligase [Rothia dentocariosa]|uniref:biotin--[acetyl-CoA-carboxylase] ligase n=1 Tax=Rothia dentocariosa TaxID=2047 RepID=UPI003C78D970
MMVHMSLPDQRPATLDPSRILPEAREAGYSFVRVYDVVDTTNTEIVRRLTRGEPCERTELGELSVFTTLYMTAGKGRMDRSWTAPAGTCLATSIVVRPHAGIGQQLPPTSYHWLTMLAGLSVLDVWRELGLDAALKWPNDLVIQGRKACGILALLLSEPTQAPGEKERLSIVVGIGQNLNMREDQVPVPTATSALIQRGEPVDNHVVLNRMLTIFARRYREFVSVGGDPQKTLLCGQSLLDQARAATVTLGAEVSVHLPDGRIVTGVSTDLDAQGRILIRDTTGAVQAYSVGDIEHLRPADGSYGNFYPALRQEDSPTLAPSEITPNTSAKA